MEVDLFGEQVWRFGGQKKGWRYSQSGRCPWSASWYENLGISA